MPREQRCMDDSVRMDKATPHHRNHHTIVSGQLFSRKLYQGTPCCSISYSTSSLRGLSTRAAQEHEAYAVQDNNRTLEHSLTWCKM